MELTLRLLPTPDWAKLTAVQKHRDDALNEAFDDALTRFNGVSPSYG